MRNLLNRVYYYIFRKEIYGAILECDRLKKMIFQAKRAHKKSCLLEKQFYDTRARLERLKRGKRCV